MNKRNMIPESNGLYKVNMKEKISKSKFLKRSSLVILFIFLLGFIFQYFSNFIANEKISASLYYAKVNGKKMEYKSGGSGDYTVVFDGAIGTTLYQWDEITKELQDLGLKTFVYNRSGYGFSTASQRRTPKQQAEDLKILLRKAGITGKLILVGEEYGSLIMTNFAKEYPENVSAMLLIRPLDENVIKSDKYKNEIKLDYMKSKLEYIGSYFGLTELLDYFNLTYEVEIFENSLNKYIGEEYEMQKNKRNYRQAINNELTNLYKYNGNSQISTMMNEKPLYIISNTKNNPLEILGNEELTTVYKTKSKKEIISVTDKDAVVSGVKNIVRTLKK